MKELRDRLGDQFKTKVKQLNVKANEKDQALQAALKEKENLEQRLAVLQEELSTANIEKGNAEERASSGQAKPNQGRAQSEGEEGQVDETVSTKPADADIGALRDQLAVAEAKAGELGSRSAALEEEVASSKTLISELESQIVSIRMSSYLRNILMFSGRLTRSEG